MNIVIIGQNEGVFVKKMLISLQTTFPMHKRIWILDRCSDDSERILKDCGEFIITTDPKLAGRQTSFSRNLGLQFADENEDVLFLDGDRYIVSGNFDPCTWDKDVALFKLEDDPRDKITKFNENNYGTVHNAFYSCGVFIKRTALNKILDFQKGELFLTQIQQDWGIEDTYLGDVCYHLNLSCDFYDNLRLHGKFEKTRIDNINILKKRFELRDKLKVKW